MREQRGQLLGLTFAVATLLTLGVLFHWPGGQHARADNGTAVSVQTVCNTGSTYTPGSATAATTVLFPAAVACGVRWAPTAAYTANALSIDWDDGSAPYSSSTLAGSAHTYAQQGSFSVVATITVCSTAKPASCARIAGSAARVQETASIVHNDGCGNELAPDGQYDAQPCSATPRAPSSVATSQSGAAGAP